ncbi:MAG TPA: hypothetical protein VFI31_01100 [Pirellulales bacterium]|nr:hypothetical protein [Pirellulales bacterium]
MSHRVGNLFWSAVGVILLTAAAHAADKTGQPAREAPLPAWIGDDVGICLEFDGLPQNCLDFYESPLGKRLRGFPPVVAWREQHRAQLAAIRAEIERRTGVPAKDLCGRLIGARVLFAIWPPHDPAIDKPSALLLAEAGDRELLQSTLERLTAVRKKAGKWRGTQTIELAGNSYTVEALASDDEQSEFFITSVNSVAVIATSEPLLRNVLERCADSEPRTTSLASSQAYLASRERPTKEAAANLFINPRAWDDALEADLKQKKPGSEEARSQAAVVAVWRATDYVAASLQVAPRLRAELAWKWRSDALPPAVREVVASLAGPSEFVEMLPADALVALAGRADFGRLARLVVAEQWSKAAASGPRSDAQAHYNDHPETLLAWALAPGLGPAWGGYLTAARDQARAEGSPSVDVVFGMETRALEHASDRPALARSVEPLLHAWFSAAVAAVNRQSGAPHASIRSLGRSLGAQTPGDPGDEVTVVTGIVPHRPEQELAYRVDERDRLWIGTSAASVAQATAPRPDRLLDNLPLDADRGPIGTPSGLAYVNLAAWRTLAAKGRAAIDFLWQDQRLDERAKERKYRELLAVAQLADRLLLATHLDDSTVRLVLAISADE